MNFVDLEMLVVELNSAGEKVPTTIGQIPDFPFRSFDSLKSSVKDRAIIIQRFALKRETAIQRIISTPYDNFVSSVLTIILIGGLILPLVFAFMFSGWWLFLLILVPFVMGRIGRHYDKVVFSAALQSELAFCFLYFSKQISITTPDYSRSYYWNWNEKQDLEPTKHLEVIHLLTSETQKKPDVLDPVLLLAATKYHGDVLFRQLQDWVPTVDILNMQKLNRLVRQNWYPGCILYAYGMITLQKLVGRPDLLTSEEHKQFTRATLEFLVKEHEKILLEVLSAPVDIKRLEESVKIDLENSGLTIVKFAQALAEKQDLPEAAMIELFLLTTGTTSHRQAIVQPLATFTRNTFKALISFPTN